MKKKQRKVPLIPFYFDNGMYINLIKGIAVIGDRATNLADPTTWEYAFTPWFFEINDPLGVRGWSKSRMTYSELWAIIQTLDLANSLEILEVYQADTSWMNFKATRVEVRLPSIKATIRTSFIYGNTLATRNAALRNAFRTRNLLKVLVNKCTTDELTEIAQIISNNPDHLSMFN